MKSIIVSFWLLFSHNNEQPIQVHLDNIKTFEECIIVNPQTKEDKKFNKKCAKIIIKEWRKIK